MALQRRSVVWLDAAGRTTQTILNADPNSSAIMAALENHSNAGVIEWWEGPSNFPAGSNANATFASVIDLARITYVTAGGSSLTVAIPAPKANIFLADTVTVDPSAIADVTTAVLGHLATPGGIVAASYVIGVRNQRDSGR